LRPLAAPAEFARICFMGYATVAVGRGFLYEYGFAPPISLWGRFLHFRWVIPCYDQLFVAPLCAGLGSFAVVVGLEWN
jgi:hypothetical protein